MHRSHGGRPGEKARLAVIFALAIAAAMSAAFTTGARAADPLSEQDKACLGCHAFAGMEKKAANGSILSLQIPEDNFAKSVHSVISCAGCHTDVSLPNHPGDVKEIASLRSYSIASIEACRMCHDDKFKQWEGSIHASLVRDGNPAAPICTNCHNPHAVIKGAASTMESVPCKNCHSDVYDAYASSVHGKLRSTGQIVAPLCAGCHTPHSISPADMAMGNGLNTACTGCHADVAEQHKSWLPNSALHFEVVSCPACHAPGHPRRVDLKLINDVTQARISEKKGVPQFEGRARAQDVDGKGLSALELWSLLRTFNSDDVDSKTVLRGRLEMRNGADAHKLVAKSQAISDCNTCHQKGAEAFQTVTVSIVDANGMPIRYGAESDVLSSIVSIDAVRGFYALGATRIQLLDVLLIMAFFGALAIPIGHLTLGWLIKRAVKSDGGLGPHA